MLITEGLVLLMSHVLVLLGKGIKMLFSLIRIVHQKG